MANRLQKVLDELPKGVRLVAVSKFHTKEFIEKAYAKGQRIFGENTQQELQEKATNLPKDIEWHFIGHLQRNKVKHIAPYISMIESVDSYKLLEEINKQAVKNDRIIDVLLELHMAKEETKFGFSRESCIQMLDQQPWRNLSNARICGIMTMASNVNDAQRIAKEFDEAFGIFNELKEKYFAGDDAFRERSWGMSRDYGIAIKHHSTLVRIGSYIFGPRVY